MRVSIFIKTIAAAYVLAVASASPVFSQGVTRSAQIPGLRPFDVDLKVITRAEKDSVRMVAELWKNYVQSFTSSEVSESQRRSMWVNGSSDYLQEFDDGNLLYASFRENRILDIRKINSGTYEIIVLTRSKLPGEEYEDWVESVYRVFAMSVAETSRSKGKLENPFRLCNYLDAVIPTLPKTSASGIDYFCSGGCSVPKAALKETSSFVSTFMREYGISDFGPIEYLVSPSVDQCGLLSGFLFNVYSNPLMASSSSKSSNGRFYGRTFGSLIVLSNFYDDRYDLALLMIRSGNPKALPMLQEGVSAYHGGYMDCSFQDMKSSLRSFLKKNPIDFSLEDNLYDIQVPLIKGGRQTTSFPLESLLGAVLVEHCINAYGAWKVRDLLGCSDYLKIYPALGVSAKDINSLISSLLK